MRLHSNNLETRQDCRLWMKSQPCIQNMIQATYGRISSVSTQRNETHITMAFATGLVVGPNDTETRIFSSRARVGLQRAGVEPGDFAQIVFQFLGSDVLVNVPIC